MSNLCRGAPLTNVVIVTLTTPPQMEMLSVLLFICMSQWIRSFLWVKKKRWNLSGGRFFPAVYICPAKRKKKGCSSHYNFHRIYILLASHNQGANMLGYINSRSSTGECGSLPLIITYGKGAPGHKYPSASIIIHHGIRKWTYGRTGKGKWTKWVNPHGDTTTPSHSIHVNVSHFAFPMERQFKKKI